MKTIGFKLNMDSHRQVNHDGENSDDEYRYRGTTTTTWSFESIDQTDSYPDAVLYLDDSEDFDPNAQYYMLYAIWSTGDSFGHDEDECCEALIVYKDVNLAKKIAARLTDTKEYNIKIDNGCGGEVDLYCGWVGYFERLTEIVIQPFNTSSNKITFRK